jgi:Zn-dependent protease with chaperone function
MERESLLTVLTIMLGGVALQVIGAWLSTHSRRKPGFELERAAWLRLWRPLIPALVVAAWLCGWALSQPDPVPHRVGPLVFIVCAPFALIGVRAILRAGWSLLGSPEPFGIATVGLIRPHIVFAPELAKLLDERAIQAALAHERAHVRHLDPLRIWIAQFVTDLQWPWASAQRRFETWLEALEHARDDEARAQGAGGADLAAALVASVRFHRNIAPGVCARLIGSRSALAYRVERLLQPLEGAPRDRTPTTLQVVLFLALALMAALALGTIYGERFVGTLLAFS